MILILLLAIAFATDGGDLPVEPVLPAVPEVVVTTINSMYERFNVLHADEQNYREMLANVVRLAFHACAGEVGCCGLVDQTLDSNNGLALSIDFLETFMVDAWTAQGFERGDLYALAGLTAVNLAMEDEEPIDGVLQRWSYGRSESCPEGTVATQTFPDSHESPFEYFDTHFGFSTADTITIMGAHTLGRAVPENSGFDGFWVQPNDRLTLGTEFFDRLVDNPWEQITVDNGQVQWDQNGLLALNSDMLLIRDFETNANGQAPNPCANNFNQCNELGANDDLASAYANNQLDFETAFHDVFGRMITSAGEGTSQDLTDFCDSFDCATAVLVRPGAPNNNNNNNGGDNNDSGDSDSEEEVDNDDDNGNNDESMDDNVDSSEDNNVDSSEDDNVDSSMDSVDIPVDPVDSSDDSSEDSSSDSNDGPGGRGRGGRPGGRGGRGGRGRRLLFRM